MEITDAIVDITNIDDVVLDDARMAEEHGGCGMAETSKKQLSENDIKKEQVEKKTE